MGSQLAALIQNFVSIYAPSPYEPDFRTRLDALVAQAVAEERERSELVVSSLIAALEFCRDYDRSPEPEYGEVVRGHKPPSPGSRFLRPRDRARIALEHIRAQSPTRAEPVSGQGDAPDAQAPEPAASTSSSCGQAPGIEHATPPSGNKTEPPAAEPPRPKDDRNMLKYMADSLRSRTVPNGRDVFDKIIRGEPGAPSPEYARGVTCCILNLHAGKLRAEHLSTLNGLGENIRRENAYLAEQLGGAIESLKALLPKAPAEPLNTETPLDEMKRAVKDCMEQAVLDTKGLYQNDTVYRTMCEAVDYLKAQFEYLMGPTGAANRPKAPAGGE